MNQPPTLPGSFAAPPPPPQPSAQPAAQQVDYEAEAKRLIPSKITFRGQSCTTPEQVEWAYGLLMHVHQGDKMVVYGYINSSQPFDIGPIYDKYAPKEAAQQPQAQATPAPAPKEVAPPNPVSHQTEEQVAQPPAADPPATPGEDKAEEPPADPAKLAGWDRITGKQMKNMTGLKRRLTSTHKMDWKDYCAQFGLNEKTGLPEEPGAPDAPPPNQTPTSPPPPAPGLPTTQQADGTLAVAAPPTPAEQAQPVPPTEPVLLPDLQRDPSFDYRGVALQLVPLVCVDANTSAPLTAAQADDVFAYFSAFLDDHEKVSIQTYDMYVWYWLNQAYEEQKKLPVDLQAFLSSAESAPAPTPAPAEPIATFQPVPAPPATTEASAQQMDTATQLVTAAASGALGHEAQQLVQQAAVPASVASQAQPTAQNAPSGSRAEIAQLLGGPVDCVFVPLIETAGVDLSGRIDANQLVGLAEIEGLRQVTDPERLKYREDRKVAMIEFGKLLSQHARVYVLVKGYDWVLDANFQDILLRRVCSGGIVKGGQYVPFNL